MHFWIDKRSQSCGFGRARVAASLAGSGIGFGHHPRRIGGKHMVPPIHRYPPVEYRSSSSSSSRPHHHPHRSNHQPSTDNSSTTGSTSNTHHHHHQSSASQSHPQPSHSHRQHTGHHHPAAASSSNGAGRPAETSTVTRHDQRQQQQTATSTVGGSEPARLQQFRNILFHRPPAAAASANATAAARMPLPATHLQHASHADVSAVQLSSGAALAQTVSSAQYHPMPLQAACRIPARYLGPHTIDLEHGALGIGPGPPATTPAPAPSEDTGSGHLAAIPAGVVAAAAAAATVSFETQLLPAHLKCGMWASLALATVFVAGAKLITLDQQGTGLEVLIFGALSMLFFMGACAVSLCRRPRDIVAAASTAVAGPAALAALQDSGAGDHGGVSGGASTGGNGTRAQTDFAMLSQQSGHGESLEQRLAQVVQDLTTTLTLAAPPPPYHIAILLPDVDDENGEESPPPSYDKLMV